MEQEEIKYVSRASMVTGEVYAIKTTDQMFILREKGRSSRSLLIRDTAYDIV